MTVPSNDDIIIDPSLLVEPDVSDEIDEIVDDEVDTVQNGLTIEWEEITDDEEFDEGREDLYENYEDDPSILDGDTDDA